MASDSHEFRITLGRDVVTGEYSRPGADRPATLGDAPIRRTTHLETIQLLEQWLTRWEWIAAADDGRGRLLVPDTFRVLGNQLWEMALSEVPGQKLIDVVSQARKTAPQRGPTVRVRMSFTKDASDLAELPWEFVHLPGETPFFLAAETSLTLGRYLDGEEDRDQDFRSADDKLRVLFVVSLPPSRKFDDEREVIDQLLDELDPRRTDETGSEVRAGSRMQLERVHGWDATQVEAKLADFRVDAQSVPVDVVHLVALFRTVGDDKPQLYLPVEGTTRWEWGDPYPVVRALTKSASTRPKLVVLHLCDWLDAGESEAPEHFEQLAPAFIRAEIPAVLAMRYPMHPKLGQMFVSNLYRRLGEGENIGAAVQAARGDLLARANPGRYFGTPALYMQSRVDGNLVERRAAADEEAARTARTGAVSARLGPREPLRRRIRPLKSLLTQILDDIVPSTATSRALQDWLQDQNWPESVAAIADQEQADALIRLERRRQDDNDEADEILHRMHLVVRDLAEQVEVS